MPTAHLTGPPSGPGSDEAALRTFLATLPGEPAVAARTFAHAWTASGGTFQAGKLTVRLLAQGPNGKTYTAATLHAPGQAGTARLELGRVLLYGHGLGPTDWTSWCDERPELAQHGFDRAAKYPSVPLEALPPAVVARLALGLRDLCRLAQGQAA
ncbi:MAG: hypothetical protein WC876_07895 [Candidatus Thermoplasmatota archaeon]|jgi:hypothetical protein